MDVVIYCTLIQKLDFQCGSQFNRASKVTLIGAKMTVTNILIIFTLSGLKKIINLLPRGVRI